MILAVESKNNMQSTREWDCIDGGGFALVDKRLNYIIKKKKMFLAVEEERNCGNI